VVRLGLNLICTTRQMDIDFTASQTGLRLPPMTPASFFRYGNVHRPRHTGPDRQPKPCGKVKMTTDDRPLRYHSEQELFEIIRNREGSKRNEEDRWEEFQQNNSFAFERGQEWVWETSEYKRYSFIVGNMDRDLKAVSDELAARREDRKHGSFNPE
jgi:hypothetical protein